MLDSGPNNDDDGRRRRKGGKGGRGGRRGLLGRALPQRQEEEEEEEQAEAISRHGIRQCCQKFMRHPFLISSTTGLDHCRFLTYLKCSLYVVSAAEEAFNDGHRRRGNGQERRGGKGGGGIYMQCTVEHFCPPVFLP